jgi:hypothetical protein
MSSIAQDVAFQTLDALEQRLQRVRFLLYGSASAAAADNDDQTPTDTTITQTQSVASRLQALQSSFNSVLSDSKSAQAIVALRNSRLSHTMFPTRLTTSQNHNINTMALT